MPSAHSWVRVVIFALVAIDDLPAWAANRTPAELPEIHEKLL
jgi:hypothetical protein